MSTYYCDKPRYFINDDIHYLINHCILRHTSSTVYYSQGNGQVESINKVFGTLFTKLVNENWNDWDEHMSIVILFDMIVFKVGTGHIPFQLVYGLYPLLLIEYLLPSKVGQIYDPNHVKVLTSRLLELENL